jgi:2-polyprenyl-6-methoxyphenol hydroxylase-like FAD-dependent oxidoreductase
MITRFLPHNVVVNEARKWDVEVNYGKRLVRVVDNPGAPVTAIFEDGSAAEGDFLVGGDGIGSQVRNAAMPEDPKPEYTSMMAHGGFSPGIGGVSFDPGTRQKTHLIFGSNGFFGYVNVITSQGPQTM